MTAECQINDCIAPVRSRGWCRTHYDRWKRHGDPLVLVRPRRHDEPPTCSEGDGKPVDARGLCSMHYRRWRLYGTTADRTQTREEAFWTRVWKGSGDRCWLWAGTVRPDGYGAFQYDGVRVMAHRAAYEMLVGPIPDGLDLDHLCRVRNCIRPTHLEPVTRRVNVLRGVGPSAQAARRDECANGHEYTEESTYWYRGYRMCRVCPRERREAVAACQ